MTAQGSRSRLALGLGLAAALAVATAGCGGPGASEGTAAPISPAMKKKVDEHFKDYAKRAAARAQARHAKKS